MSNKAYTRKFFILLFLTIALSLVLTSSFVSSDVFAQHDVFHGTRTVAGFHIELTVEPMPIEPGKLTKFGTDITSAATGEPVENVPHTFVLMKDTEIIFKETTDSASTIHEFKFMEEHKGPLTVIIENVNNSGESVEFGLTVIPEFPVNLMLITTIGLISALITFRLKVI